MRKGNLMDDIKSSTSQGEDMLFSSCFFCCSSDWKVSSTHGHINTVALTFYKIPLTPSLLPTAFTVKYMEGTVWRRQNEISDIETAWQVSFHFHLIVFCSVGARNWRQKLILRFNHHQIKFQSGLREIGFSFIWWIQWRHSLSILKPFFSCTCLQSK